MSTDSSKEMKACRNCDFPIITEELYECHWNSLLMDLGAGGRFAVSAKACKAPQIQRKKSLRSILPQNTAEHMEMPGTRRQGLLHPRSPSLRRSLGHGQGHGVGHALTLLWNVKCSWKTGVQRQTWSDHLAGISQSNAGSTTVPPPLKKKSRHLILNSLALIL